MLAVGVRSFPQVTLAVAQAAIQTVLRLGGPFMLMIFPPLSLSLGQSSS